MKKPLTKSTTSSRRERKKLVLRRDTMRTLSAGFTGDTGNGDNTACTGNETGCVASAACPV
jgi:hypothetical protein